VTRLLGDHREEKEAKLAVVEQPAASVPAALAVVRMIGETLGGEMMAGAIPVSSFHELRSTVPAVTPAAFTVVVTVGEVVGWGEMMAGAIPVSMFHHDCDIDRDISNIKIYLNLDASRVSNVSEQLQVV
jgi:hypothetical protein